MVNLVIYSNGRGYEIGANLARGQRAAFRPITIWVLCIFEKEECPPVSILFLLSSSRLWLSPSPALSPTAGALPGAVRGMQPISSDSRHAPGPLFASGSLPASVPESDISISKSPRRNSDARISSSTHRRLSCQFLCRPAPSAYAPGASRRICSMYIPLRLQLIALRKLEHRYVHAPLRCHR